MYRPHVDFALALDRQLPATGDLAWSPYSVASAIGLAAAGARGATRDELSAALAPGGDLQELGRALRAAASPGEAEAAVANTLWARLGLQILDGYRQELLGWPGGGVELADFAGDPEGARRAINADVEKTTRGLIRELVKRGTIRSDVGAVVVNALYLKVAWRLPFPQEATGPEEFHAPAGTHPVPTMRLKERLAYAERDGWRMVTLPTAADVVVDVLLPPDGGRLTADTLTRLSGAATTTLVDLALPRFRVTTELELNGPLRTLGMASAFLPNEADFSGITTDDRLYVSNVVHQTVLRVDEQGFEGAAATALVMRAVAMVVADPVPFRVDRPFLVLVRHRDTGVIYFLARVTDPA